MLKGDRNTEDPAEGCGSHLDERMGLGAQRAENIERMRWRRAQRS